MYVVFKRLVVLGILFVAMTAGAAGGEWVSEMEGRYITPQVTGYFRSDILNALRETAPGSQEWVAQMAERYITAKMSGGLRSDILAALSRTPPERQGWVKEMAERYITDEMSGVLRSDILAALSAAHHPEGQGWMERMAERYITAEMPVEARYGILTALSWTAPEIQVWEEEMAERYIHAKMHGYYRSDILNALRKTAPGSKEWVKEMAERYIPAEMSGDFRSDIFRPYILNILSATPPERQGWVEEMAERYITAEMPVDFRSGILNELKQVPPEGQKWVKGMAERYITAEMSGDFRSGILNGLRATAPGSQEWVAWMAKRYITAEMPVESRYGILDALSATPPERQGWVEGMLIFLVDPQTALGCVPLVMNNLSQLMTDLPTPELLEQARLRLVEGANQALEGGQGLRDFLPRLTTTIRDELTQEMPINAAARPLGRAFEVHFASVLGVPSGERAESVPLYKAVDCRLQGLTTGRCMKMVAAVLRLHHWIDVYADPEKKALYHRVVEKGYGDGSTPPYNQEITPLLRFAVLYMEAQPDEVQRTWLLPALEESATAYDEGEPISCGRGIQERLTVLGFDVEGIDSVLRSLSLFARNYLYITDPTTNGADTWVKSAVSHLSGEERQSLLVSTQPDKEVFNKMFMDALPKGFTAIGLAPVHIETLLGNPHIHESFKNSLEMHYEYPQHYAALQEKARELEDEAAGNAPKPAQPPAVDDLDNA